MSAPTRRAPSVLVVEDRASIRCLLEELLAQDGLRVRAAATTQEALEALDATTPDLVLVDLLLPGGCGDALVQTLRSRPATSTTPVIVVSGLDGAELISRELGVQEFVPKPFDVRHLLERIHFHLAAVSTS